MIELKIRLIDPFRVVELFHSFMNDNLYLVIFMYKRLGRSITRCQQTGLKEMTMYLI